MYILGTSELSVRCRVKVANKFHCQLIEAASRFLFVLASCEPYDTWLSDNNLLESWNHEKHLLSLLYKIKLSANTIELLENLNGGYIKHPEINSFLMFIKYNRLAGIGVYWRSRCMLELKIQQNTPLNCTQYTPIKIYLWVV